MVSRGESDISAVAVKLPPWFEDTELWLKQVEAAFEINRPKITLQKTRYYHLLSVLPGQILKLVADKLNPEVDRPYDELVDAIRARFRPSPSSNFEVIRNVKLDGRRPYELLADLKANFRHLDSDSGSMLREAFIRAMPESIKNVLIAAAKYTPIEGLVEIADNMLTQHRGVPVNTIDLPSSSAVAQESRSSNATESIQQQIDDLRMEVMQIAAGPNSKYAKRRTLCFFHQKFGTRAYKCVQPCDWKPNPSRRFKRGNWFQGN